VESIELATEHDMHVWRAVGTVVLGASTVALGAAEEGMRWIREGLDRYRGLRTPPVFWPFLLEVTANACRHSGETDFGLASIDEALSVTPTPQLRLARGGLLEVRDLAEAVAEYEAALAGALGWGAATVALAASVRLCRLAEGADAAVVAARRGQVEQIVDGFTEGLDHPLVTEAREILAEG
jgi:hypothetical protein